jgi:hypothetical protein
VATDIARFLEETGWDLSSARQDIIGILTNAARVMALERRSRRWPRRTTGAVRVENPTADIKPRSEEPGEDPDNEDGDNQQD